jgi:AcrR family transcriptional regulator
MLSSFPHPLGKLDPRVKRTRELIQRSFMEIVDEKGFNSISVQDITARAGINRATFYAHFPDKYALLDYAIGEMFRAEIERRMLNVCEFRLENLRTLVVAVCEFVGKIHTHTDHEEQYQTLAEAQIRSQVYGLILHWLEKIETIRNCSVSRERAATAASWAIYGLAHQWTHEKRKSSAETFADEVMPLVAANLGQTIELAG